MSKLPDPSLLLANAPEVAIKDNDNFDWECAIVSQNYDDLKSKLGRPKQTIHKQPTTIRLDPAILEYFKSQGKGWQTKINAVLNDYIKSNPI